MRPLLEDMCMGPAASPALSQEIPFRWEDSRRRVRVIFAGVTVADSTHVMLLLEYGRLPVFYFPPQDVRHAVLEKIDQHTHSPLNGEASYWTIRAGGRVAAQAAWSYLSPPPDGPQLKGYMAFYWNKMDAWYEEDEQVYAHARDPYKGLDVLPTSRHVQVVLGGVTIADSLHAWLLLETGLPTRYYIPQQDIQMELLQTSETDSRCPYKGQASYWSATIGARTFKDIVWSYRDPLPACVPIASHLSFFNERVDAISVDGEVLVKPRTQWSED